METESGLISGQNPNKVKMTIAQSCPTLCDPRDYVALWVPLSIKFSRQKYWSGWLFPSSGDLADPGIKSGSPALQADSLPSELPRKPRIQVAKKKACERELQHIGGYQACEKMPDITNY